MRVFNFEEEMAKIEERQRRERWYKPGVWMFRAAKRHARDARLAVRWARQRVFRGWDDRAIWALDDHLSKSLGEQLVMMADVAHSYPGDDYPFDRWVADLRKHGEALRTYHDRNYELDGDEWTATYEPAREALRWVADNLSSLWD